jgi:spore maturation protein CgeB
MAKQKIKILLASDVTNFALTDVFHGYQNAMTNLGIDFETFPYHKFRELFSETISCHVMHSTALIKSKGCTHIMFIGGLNIPEWMLESMYHLKTVVVATEDPHTFDPLRDRLDKIDYYFSNERSIGNSTKFKNTYYCPTAGCTTECGKIPQEHLESQYHSDLLFLGALYPNRAKILEALIPLVEKKKLNFKICGHVGYIQKKSPLWRYVYDARTIPHLDTVKYYNGAKAVINILRDVKWNAKDNTRKNPFNTGRFAPESLNPRAYEVPLCQAFLIQDDSRTEAREIFSENEVGFFSGAESLVKTVKKYLIGRASHKRDQMALNAYRKVAESHTYSHRMLQIKHILEEDM